VFFTLIKFIKQRLDF